MRHRLVELRRGGFGQSVLLHFLGGLRGVRDALTVLVLLDGSLSSCTTGAHGHLVFLRNTLQRLLGLLGLERGRSVQRGDVDTPCVHVELTDTGKGISDCLAEIDAVAVELVVSVVRLELADNMVIGAGAPELRIYDHRLAGLVVGDLVLGTAGFGGGH